MTFGACRRAARRASAKFGVAVDAYPPQVGYRETIRRPVAGVRGRHKKQSGGHGQFGDVVVDVAPTKRGEGFAFVDKITGGVVPRQFIPSVEEGVRSYLKRGPLGFPVVDVGVSLTDGSYHTVDSSDMAFQMAAKIAMEEGMAACSPVLLEPIMKVEIFTPSEATAKATAIVSQRRGQIRVVAAVHRRRPGSRPVQADDHPHRRRLACTVRSEEAGDHPWPDGEGEPLDGRLLAIALGERTRLDHEALRMVMTRR